MHFVRVLDEGLVLHRGRTVIGNPELDRRVVECTDHEVRDGVTRARPREAGRTCQREIEFEDRPDDLVAPLQRVVSHAEGHRVLQLPAVVVLSIHAWIRQVERSRHGVAHTPPVVANIDVDALVARSDLGHRPAARSRCQVRKSDLVDKPGPENVRIAYAELIHIAEDRLLDVVQISGPRGTVASVCEEVGVDLVAA